ncbi:MAG: hypothetical protein GY953_12045, partial [bacterium]|nr:hypothetical protein [bacterium]
MSLKLGARFLLFFAATVAATAIDRLDPPAVAAGGPAFTLQVIGEELEAADLIRWKRDDEGEWRVPNQRFINDKLFELDIPAAWIATPGSAAVQFLEDGEGAGGGDDGSPDDLKFEILPRSSVPVARDDTTQTLPGVSVVVNVVANDSV